MKDVFTKKYLPDELHHFKLVFRSANERIKPYRPTNIYHFTETLRAQESFSENSFDNN